ncbi:MAG: hypothetical protein AAF702_38540 [Chloroflexota bacterium]
MLLQPVAPELVASAASLKMMGPLLCWAMAMASSTLWRWLAAVLGPEGGRSSGDYFEPDGKRSEPSTRNAELAARLWSMSEWQIAT